MAKFRQARASLKPLLREIKLRGFIDPQVNLKRVHDARQLPLDRVPRDLYRNIHAHAKVMGSRFPRLVEPSTYRDHLSWLMLFDQNPEKITCSDKFAVRSWVEKRIGASFLIPLVSVSKRIEIEKLRDQEQPFVVKLNNDSGGVRAFFPPLTSREMSQKVERLNSLQSRVYGWEKGEWPYRFIPPFVLVEEFVGNPRTRQFPTEYKFHCVDGEIGWIQIISDRQSAPRELLLDSDGTHYPFTWARKNHLDEWRTLPKQWDEMRFLARKLSAGFKYVRVDLLLCDSKIFFGEMTFFPLAGFPTDRANELFGPRMTFDRNPEFNLPFWPG